MDSEGSLSCAQKLSSQPNPVRLIDPYLRKVHLDVILKPMPRLSQLFLPFGSANQNPVNTSPLPPACQSYVKQNTNLIRRELTELILAAVLITLNAVSFLWMKGEAYCHLSCP